MSDYVLTVPEEVYTRARQLAAETAQAVDEIMIAHLRTLPALLPSLNPDEEAELEAMRHLSDDTLWTIAREQMASTLQSRLQALMERNSLGSITQDESVELGLLVERGERLTLRKSEAAALLTQRGYRITPHQ
jgi:hypothetical protein